MYKNLRILAWNVNGLLQHKQELQMYLDTKKIDVCLISETHFINQNYLKLKGYQVYCTNHPSNSARGGSAIIKIALNTTNKINIKLNKYKQHLSV